VQSVVICQYSTGCKSLVSVHRGLAVTVVSEVLHVLHNTDYSSRYVCTLHSSGKEISLNISLSAMTDNAGSTTPAQDNSEKLTTRVSYADIAPSLVFAAKGEDVTTAIFIVTL